MNGDTLSRDIRLTKSQLWAGRGAALKRARELERRLERTSYAGKPGMEASVRDELLELQELLRIFRVALDALERQTSNIEAAVARGDVGRA